MIATAAARRATGCLLHFFKRFFYVGETFVFVERFFDIRRGHLLTIANDDIFHIISSLIILSFIITLYLISVNTSGKINRRNTPNFLFWA